MPISDLTGTTWIINEEPSVFVPSASINFTSNGNSYTSISERLSSIIRYNSTQVYSDGVGWIDQAYRTIEITGGTDATNPDLIAWLQANATQQTPVQTSSGMYLGTLGISKIFMGNSEVSKIYLGDALVYEGVSIPDNALLTADSTYLVDSTGGYLLTTEI